MVDDAKITVHGSGPAGVFLVAELITALERKNILTEDEVTAIYDIAIRLCEGDETATAALAPSKKTLMWARENR